MSTTSYKIASDLFLVWETAPVAKAPTAPKPKPTNHVVVIDVSGSMSYELPKLRTQLKDKLVHLLRDDDTVSIIWFSGRGEFGVLTEAAPVVGVKDLSKLHQAIDRWLRPVGMTGFREPLEEVAALVKRVKNGNPFSLFFMSDGCDNQWNRAQILDAVKHAAAGLAAATFVEYGYYADRAMLTAMATKAGGAHIFAQDFGEYEPVFAAAMQRQAVGDPAVALPIKGDPIGGFVFTLDRGPNTDAGLYTYEVAAGAVTVPKAVTGVWYVAAAGVGAVITPKAKVYGTPAAAADPAVAATYAALSLYAARMQPKVVYPLLRTLGDARLIRDFTTCFGKQRYSAFMDATKTAAFDAAARWRDGYDPTLVPPDDAFTVFDLLRVLNDGHTLLDLDHEAFTYSRISRGRVNADEHLTVAETAELAELREAMGKTRAAKKLKELQARIDEILSTKQDALTFKPTPVDGYPLASLTYNESRANISLLAHKTGTVDLSARLKAIAGTPAPATVRGLPAMFPTHIWRNYAVLKDGLVNIAKLPVCVTPATLAQLTKAGVKFVGEPSLVPMTVANKQPLHRATIDVNALPILNLKTVRDVSAEQLARTEWALTCTRAAQKVYKGLIAAQTPPGPKSANLIGTYGAEAAAWLVEQGISDNGFSPKQTVAPVKDVYIGRELAVEIDGYKSLPALTDVRDRLAKLAAGGTKTKPLTGGAALMAGALDEAKDWSLATLQAALAATERAIKQHLHEKSQMIVAVIVGQTWFKEFKSLDENTYTLTTATGPVTVTFTQREVEIEI